MNANDNTEPLRILIPRCKTKQTFYHPLCELNLDLLNDINNDILNETPSEPIIQDSLLERPENGHIRLLTYNIFLRSLVKNNHSDWKEERLEDFCRLLKNYDIICLQEMFGTLSSRKQKLIRAATISGFFFFVDTSSPDFLSRYLADGGLMILSRFPIVANLYHKFRYGVVADSLAEKGLIYAKISIKDCYLHLFTTHLQASYFESGETNFIASLETRKEQIRFINYLITEVLDKEYDKKKDKVLLVGDMNVDARGYAYKELVKSIFI